MAHKSFAELRGFTSDPFASTNSESEDNLEEYFVPPPYFDTVIGDPRAPKGSVIFAPRGSGKTAQRLMIEHQSILEESTFLCLTYDTFDGLVASYTLQKHQIALCRLLTIAILVRLEGNAEDSSRLNKHQKEVLKACAEAFVGGLNVQEYQRAVQSVKSLGDRVGDFWDKYGGVVKAGLSLLMKKAGLGGVEVPSQLEEQTHNSATSIRYFYSQLVEMCLLLDWEAVYFLIDKVDETSETSGSADKAYELIRPLVSDLPTLELPGVAFKFFFWDRLKEHFDDQGGRPDRLKVVKLNWTVKELHTMLARRLSAYSERKVDNFNQLMAEGNHIDAHLLLAYLSNGSPRDMIRMAGAVISDHTRTSSDGALISDITLFQGISEFSDERSNELFSRSMNDFRKVGRPSFTISSLANDVFRISTQAARNKVQKWQQSGAVNQIGELPNDGNRPLHLFGFSDLRIGIAIQGPGKLRPFLENNCIECPSCLTLLMTEHTSLPCPSCGSLIDERAARSLAQICSIQR